MQQNYYDIVSQILVPHTAMEAAIGRINQCFTAAQFSSEPVCIPLLGPSRSGKSRILECFESKHPRQRLDDGLHIPVLRVTTPSNPSAKGLAEVMLRAIGDPAPGKGTETNMTSRLATLISATRTKMIMIDEFQHFVDKKSNKVIHHAADWLKIVIDEAKVALVVAGLPSCQAVLNQNEQLAGRFMAPVSMPRFNWVDADSREEFKAIMGAFQEGLAPFSMPKLDSDEMSFRFYCATGGLIGYVAKILQQTIWDAVDTDCMILTIEDFARAYRISIYADENSDDLPPAFDLTFSTQITETLLQRVNAIGIATPTDFPKNTATKKSIVLSASQVLHR